MKRWIFGYLLCDDALVLWLKVRLRTLVDPSFSNLESPSSLSEFSRGRFDVYISPGRAFILLSLNTSSERAVEAEQKRPCWRGS
jgi:hypothetical protein